MMAQLIEPQFHAGELAAQQRAGVAPRGSAIRDAMPDQHRLFFTGLPFVLVATTDEAADPALLADLIDRCEVTYVQATPSTWRVLADQIRLRPRIAVSTGEALDADNFGSALADGLGRQIGGHGERQAAND